MNRYIITTSYYAWANSDEEAIANAKELAAKEDLQNDNKCFVESVVEQLFGTFKNRPLLVK